MSKDLFVSLRLPYSVRKYEELAISPVIYNYGESSRQVNMPQSYSLKNLMYTKSQAFTM